MGTSAFSTLTKSADPPLVVVTTIAEGVRSGCVVGFHAQSSMDPEHYCLWLSKANYTYRVGLRATHFAVHFLTSDDLGVARHFGTRSGEDVDKFEGLDLETAEQGVPLLKVCPNRMVLERIALLDSGGDHVCLTARVLLAQAEGRFEPLRLSAADHLEPGRHGDERAIEP